MAALGKTLTSCLASARKLTVTSCFHSVRAVVGASVDNNMTSVLSG